MKRILASGELNRIHRRAKQTPKDVELAEHIVDVYNPIPFPICQTFVFFDESAVSGRTWQMGFGQPWRLPLRSPSLNVL
jgi:hypothetical protein